MQMVVEYTHNLKKGVKMSNYSNDQLADKAIDIVAKMTADQIMARYTQMLDVPSDWFDGSDHSDQAIIMVTHDIWLSLLGPDFRG